MVAHPGRIDVHHHFIPDGHEQRLRSRAPETMRGANFPAWSPEAAIALMDANGIGAAVVSIPIWGMVIDDLTFAKDSARRCNEAGAALVAEHPARFGAFATLPLLDVEGSLRELEHALDTLRLDGVCLPAHAGPHYLGAAFFDPLFAELHRRGTTVHVHPGPLESAGGFTPAVPDPIVDFPFDTTRAIANLIATGTLERFPAIRLIFSHAGGAAPFLAGRLAMLDNNPPIRERAPQGVLAYLRNIYVDTALAANQWAFPSLFALTEPSHVLFGTDWPFAPAPVAAGTVAALDDYAGLDRAARERIARRNALALFPRLAG
jgi:predicted TIM-barrel fold metal-dependent hydrolase